LSCNLAYKADLLVVLYLLEYSLIVTYQFVIGLWL